MVTPVVDRMPEGPISIDVTIDQDTRTSVSEMSGAISFSMGDRISITDGEKIYTGITSSTSSNGTFAMEDGFVPDAYIYYGVSSTFAGFPAEMVANMDLLGDVAVQFILPGSYQFNQTTSYTALNWLAMAKAGIVFIVASEGMSIPDLWISTGFSGTSAATSFTTFFNISYTQNTPYANRSIQRGVRLVHDVEYPPPYTSPILPRSQAMTWRMPSSGQRFRELKHTNLRVRSASNSRSLRAT